MDLGKIDYTVQIDVEDVLDDLDIEEIEEYLAERKKFAKLAEKPVLQGESGTRPVKLVDYDKIEEKETLINLCLGKARRNLQNDKEEVKRVINEIIDSVFY
jgi:hypothetical protein